MSKYKMLRLPSYVSLNLNVMTYYINHVPYTPLTYFPGPFATKSLFYFIELNYAN